MPNQSNITAKTSGGGIIELYDSSDKRITKVKNISLEQNINTARSKTAIAYVELIVDIEEATKTKTPTEELHYLGQMLGATTIEDKGRIDGIIQRLSEIKNTAI